MSLSSDIGKMSTIFIDTAPFIYYIEADPQFGPLSKEVIDAVQSGLLTAFSSVITLAEVLPRPVQAGRADIAERFSMFLRRGRNLTLLSISADIAEKAGWLRGRYPSIRALDAIQISSALYAETDVFLTNDKRLRRIKEIRIMLLSDYL